ncbi:hypothetical protein AD930_07850 [Acetobacter malorum]|nr:hypothetical protein AD930_07850 [Acetobacter malorum]
MTPIKPSWASRHIFSAKRGTFLGALPTDINLPGITEFSHQYSRSSVGLSGDMSVKAPEYFLAAKAKKFMHSVTW